MTPTDPVPSEPTPSEPWSTEPAAADDRAPRGLTGWLARRGEAMLHKPRRVRPELSEPGEYHVVLQLTGHSPVAVVNVISEATGLDFMSANQLARDAPAVVVSQVSEASAERVAKRLRKAGGRAVVGERYRQQ